MLWHVSKWFPFPSPHWSMRFFSLIFIVRTWQRFWEIKVTTAWSPLNNWLLLEFLTVRLSTLSIQNSSVTVQVFLYTALLPKEVFALINCDSLYSLVCLSSIRRSRQLCHLISLKDQEEMLIFQFIQILTLCQDGVTTSKFLIGQTGNWKLRLDVLTFEFAKELIHCSPNWLINCKKQAFILLVVYELYLMVAKQLI